MSRRRSALSSSALAAIAALALVAGCGDDDTNTETDTETGDAAALSGTLIEGDGYSFDLAEGYEEGDASGLAESLGAAAQGATVDSLATGETINEFATNLNVVITESLPSEDLDEVVEASLDGLQEQLDALGLGGTEIEVLAEPSETTLGDEEARQYDFVTTVEDTTYTQRQLVVLRDGRGYTITFSADGESYEEEVAGFEAMMESWEWE